MFTQIISLKKDDFSPFILIKKVQKGADKHIKSLWARDIYHRDQQQSDFPGVA